MTCFREPWPDLWKCTVLCTVFWCCSVRTACKLQQNSDAYSFKEWRAGWELNELIVVAAFTYRKGSRRRRVSQAQSFFPWPSVGFINHNLESTTWYLFNHSSNRFLGMDYFLNSLSVINPDIVGTGVCLPAKFPCFGYYHLSINGFKIEVSNSHLLLA